MVWLPGAAVTPPRREEEPPQHEAAAPATEEVQQGTIACPKCKVLMQVGRLEASYYADGFTREALVERWRGLRVPRPIFSLRQLFARIREPYRPLPALRVNVLRCPSCGFLELYAK
jgi:hypothetical protein